jgi:hypothetical protein
MLGLGLFAQLASLTSLPRHIKQRSSFIYVPARSRKREASTSSRKIPHSKQKTTPLTLLPKTSIENKLFKLVLPLKQSAKSVFLINGKKMERTYESAAARIKQLA